MVESKDTSESIMAIIPFRLSSHVYSKKFHYRYKSHNMRTLLLVSDILPVTTFEETS